MCNATYWRKLDTRCSFQPGIENFQPFLQNHIHHQHNSLNTSDTFPGAVGDTRASTLLQQSSTSCISFKSRPPILHWWQRNQRKTYTINHQAKIKDMSKAVECEFAALNGTDCWSVIMTFLLSVLKCSLELPWWRKVWYAWTKKWQTAPTRTSCLFKCIRHLTSALVDHKYVNLKHPHSCLCQLHVQMHEFISKSRFTLYIDSIKLQYSYWNV